MQASSPSGEFENDVQIYNNANIKNGFSGKGVLNLPKTGGSSKKKTDEELEKLHGPENSGGTLTIEMPLNVEGELKSAQIYEPFTLSSIDKMFVNQTENAKDNILREGRMPEILLGVSNQGMFNQAEYQDTAIYYNNKTGYDRKKVERAINSFWGNTVFSSQLSEVIITPLEFDNEGEAEENGNDTN